MSSNDRKSTLARKHSISVLSHEKTRTLTEAKKARQKKRVPGPITGCWTNEDPYIQKKQRVSPPAVRYTPTQKRTSIYILRQTSIHTGMYDCMRSDSESELGNRLPGILRRKKMHTCVSVYVCV